MRVLFLLRSDADRLIGGPTEQTRQYARALEDHGHEAVIHTRHDRPAGRFDLAHVLNVDWPLESARQMDIALGCADQVVLSPIHHRRAWVDAFHAAGRHGLGRRVADLVGLDGFERLRGLVQAARAPRLIPEAATQLARGVVPRQRAMLERSASWLVLSDRETASIVEDFGVERRPAHRVVNGGDWVDDDVTLPSLPEDFVLCVARVEARKNQLALAEALVELGVPGVFVGLPNPRHRAFVRRFAAYVDEQPSLRWFPSLGRTETLAMYRRARLHVLASWYEVAPIVDVEAAVAGCPMVTTTRGYSSDVLGDAALYWEPDTGHDGLVSAVRAALDRRRDGSRAAAFRERYSWERVRRDVVAAYLGSTTSAAPAG